MGQTEYQVVEKADAWGAIDNKTVDTSYQYLQNFYAGRNLKHVARSMEMIPWLFRARFYSKKWNATFLIHPPYQDHYRYFVDRDTKQRIVTIQPYAYDEEVRRPLTPDEFAHKVRAESEQFAREHGLHVKISPDGWYNPGKVILIEYTKA